MLLAVRLFPHAGDATQSVGLITGTGPLFYNSRCVLQLYAVNALGQMPLTLTVSKPHVSQECARILLDAMNEENTAIQRAADDIALLRSDASLGK